MTVNQYYIHIFNVILTVLILHDECRRERLNRYGLKLQSSIKERKFLVL